MFLEKIQIYSGLSLAQLERYALTASSRYKTYKIPKKNGDGERVISQPSRKLKNLQRLVVRELFEGFQVHGAATAYVKGASIRANAHKHVRSNFTLHTDFKDFFPSFDGEGISKFLRQKDQTKNLNLTHDDINFITRVVCLNNRLTIGAPCSPSITNALMFDFDQEISRWCSERGLIYTRYADDIYVSGNERNFLNDALFMISSEAQKFSYGVLAINHDKVDFLSRRYRRKITGLVITSTYEVSIGREKKRDVKSKLYKFSKSQIDEDEIEALRGYISFIKDVEPTFYDTLERKYGATVIANLHSKS